MIPEKQLEYEAVTLEIMLKAREQRQAIQRSLSEQYQRPIISFTLNIAGECKAFPLATIIFDNATSDIKKICESNGIDLIFEHTLMQVSGNEYFAVADGQAKKIKKLMLQLENSLAIGRFYDIDVINTAGQKLSRADFDIPERTCFICDRPAFECARSRRHSAEQLFKAQTGIMWQFVSENYAERLANLAYKALIFEVETTPKPGLVDSCNSGAHSDMNIETFRKSAQALRPYFYNLAIFSLNNSHLPPDELFLALRPLGIDAERDMFAATAGVNTHKGAIFSLGVLIGALCYDFANVQPYSQNQLRNTVGAMLSPLASDFSEINVQTAKTNGEKLYAKYGIKGIRGQAAEGYPAVFDCALPILHQQLEKGSSLNDAGVLTLLHIICQTEDSNIIARSDYETMQSIRKELSSYLNGAHGDFLQYTKELDKRFIAQNISPGGSADLLALSYFMYFFEQK